MHGWQRLRTGVGTLARCSWDASTLLCAGPGLSRTRPDGDAQWWLVGASRGRWSAAARVDWRQIGKDFSNKDEDEGEGGALFKKLRCVPSVPSP